MANKPKALVLDIDGVLLDSRAEIILTSWNEYNARRETLGLDFAPFTGLYSDLPPDFVRKIEVLAVKSSKMHHRVAWDLAILEDMDVEALSSEDIDRISEEDQALKESCIQSVTELRLRQRDACPITDLVTLFAEVDYDWVKARHDEGILFFLTGNVMAVDNFSAVAFAPAPAQVLGGGQAHLDKPERIRTLFDRFAPDRILFMDDRQRSLEEVRDQTPIPAENLLHNAWCPDGPIANFSYLTWEETVARLVGL